MSGLRVVNASGGFDTTGIRVDHSNHILIARNYISNTESSGIGVWNSNNVVVDGNEIVGANNGGAEENLSVDTSYDVEVKNNNVHNGVNSPKGGEGINIKNGSYNVKVYKNWVHDNPKYAFGLDGFSIYSHDIEFYDNIANNCASGFVVESEAGAAVDNVKVYNNIAYNNEGPGLYMPNWGRNFSGLKSNIYFVNNTTYNNSYGAAILNVSVQNIVVRNNIISRNVNAPQIQVASGAQAQTFVDHNLFYGVGGPVGTYALVGTPLFVNIAGGDFHVQNGSPAIDAGSSTNAPTTDFDGVARPKGAGYDIGAYER